MWKWFLSILWARPPRLELEPAAPGAPEDPNVIRPRRHLIEFAKLHVPTDPLERQQFDLQLLAKVAALADVVDQVSTRNSRVIARTWNLLLIAVVVFGFTFRAQIIAAWSGHAVTAPPAPVLSAIHAPP